MLTKRVERLTPSKTMYFTAKAKKLKAEGISVIDFSVGEPDFPTPENICEAGKKAIDSGHTKYTVVNGIDLLRKEIAIKLQTDNAVIYTPEQICVGTGAKQPLFNAVFAVCEEGDEVIIPTPGWVSYEEMVKLAGATPVFVPSLEADDFELDLDAIEKAVTKRTKAIMINTPNNPTGAVHKTETLRKLGELAVKYHFYIISDEVYEKLVYDESGHVCIASLSDEIWKQCIIINGLSKSYAMTGWRIGYAAANNEVIKAIKAIQSHTTSASNSITQYAAVEAYQGNQGSIKKMHEAFNRRRNYIIGRVNAMSDISCNTPPGAFYIMVNIKKLFHKKYETIEITSSQVMADLLLSEAHVALIAGEAFHADDYLRICYAVSDEDIEEGMNRMEQFIQKLHS
ncbi:MAG: pyridoxal phosphate-dependent aminotransferase [Lachnospiraceae bacterium]|nr:pyridoxal phosphate-dependent aminotransferase [Lachnospiraceae bacterium]